MTWGLSLQSLMGTVTISLLTNTLLCFTHSAPRVGPRLRFSKLTVSVHLADVLLQEIAKHARKVFEAYTEAFLCFLRGAVKEKTPFRVLFYSAPRVCRHTHRSLARKRKRPRKGALVLLTRLRWLDAFRTANWSKIKSELQFSGILNLFPALPFQN